MSAALSFARAVDRLFCWSTRKLSEFMNSMNLNFVKRKKENRKTKLTSIYLLSLLYVRSSFLIFRFLIE